MGPKIWRPAAGHGARGSPSGRDFGLAGDPLGAHLGPVTPSAKMQWRRQTVADFNRVADRHATKPRAVWTDLDTIIEILSDVATDAPHNHMFFPLSGGLDLCGVTRSNEAGCIELETDGQTVAVVKPANLQLERFGDDRTGDWTYLRLNLASLAPTEFHQPQEDSYSEEVVELEPGVYDERSVVEGSDCPSDARVVTRLFRGALILFAKGSLYNQVPGTYDGRHSLGLIEEHGCETTPELFRAIIETTLEGLAAPQGASQNTSSP